MNKMAESRGNYFTVYEKRGKKRELQRSDRRDFTALVGYYNKIFENILR